MPLRRELIVEAEMPSAGITCRVWTTSTDGVYAVELRDHADGSLTSDTIGSEKLGEWLASKVDW